MQLLQFFIVWLLILGGVYLIVNLFTRQQVQEVSYTRFMKMVEEGNVSFVEFNDTELRCITKDGEKFNVLLPFQDPELPKKLAEKGIEVRAKERVKLWNVVVQVLPLIFLFFLFMFFMRQMQSGPNRAFSFGKSRAKLITPSQEKVTFKDVAGVEEAKEELREVVEFLKNPGRYTKLGARIPKGVLLVGPPGTGKTLLARAVAGEAGVPFFSISGSDFVEMFVGVGAARVRDLFETAKRNTPCIVFIDEIDAVGRHRGAGIGGGHDEREQTLNALLVEMDGFETNQGIIVLAATNRPDILDHALLRPGRFDRRIVVDVPDVKGRLQILKVHTKKTPLGKDVDLEVIARTTPGFTGADLESLVNEAALIAARKRKKKLTMEDFEEAKDKILMGVARKSMILKEEEKRLIAYHEAGHTIVTYFTPHTDPIHKVTIIPRGRALGVTQQLPIDDRRTYSKEYLLAQLRVLMGGRAAEEKVFGTISTGSGNDIDRATQIARKMVCEWGMSEKLGPITLGKPGDEVFLGRDFVAVKDFSEETAKLIDEEVRRFVNEAYEEARKIIDSKEELLHKLADELLKKEVLDGHEVEVLLTNGSLETEEAIKEENRNKGEEENN
ncbi:cell division protein FtsH [bacterium]|nr:MAG: cell division protein FtsH [bacterium]RKZ22802.1 MAG: cell division protein FtsH [bacterium]